VIWLLLFACKSAPLGPDSLDAKQYATATVAEEFEVGLRACEQISTEGLRSECQAFLVQQHGRNHPERAAEICAIQPPGIWKDECHFLLAEALTVPERPAVAAAFCQQAGRYFRPCFMHLFSAHAGHLVSSLPADEVVEAYQTAITLGGENPPKDFAHLAWSLLFRRKTLTEMRFDPELCTHLKEQAIACRSGVREALLRTLQKNSRAMSAEKKQEICEHTTTTASALKPVIAKAFDVEISAHPSLDAPLTRWHTQACRSIPRK